ncbi:Ferric hydroxamate uptake [Raoultella terrigena]|uniref:Ferric hydroxamate uptake n=1 Tax=Raoultella terrigena TaxID=577 RepID=A0A4U9D884_RAOTE|nr:Ferric hydroxamate uptake [Raoultella terrigena]
MGVYLQDQLSWESWELLLSGRYDWAEVRTTDVTDASRSQKNDSKFTWRTGLLYAFDFGLSRTSATAPPLNPTCKPTGRREWVRSTRAWASRWRSA